MDYKIFKEWPFWVMIVLFFSAMGLMLGIESIAAKKDSYLPLLALFPFGYAFYLIFIRDRP
jgi:hypothetical protein